MPGKRAHARPLPSEQELARRQAVLEQALTRALPHLTPREQRLAIEDFARLVPGKVRADEWQLSKPPRSLPLDWGEGDPDALGRPPPERDVLAVLVTGRPDATWDELTAHQKHRGRSINERWTRQRAALRGPGRPPYRYTRLVESYVQLIEAHTGHSFRFSRDLEGAPCGPELELLEAALDRVLFASGPPKPENLVEIILRSRADR